MSAGFVNDEAGLPSAHKMTVENCGRARGMGAVQKNVSPCWIPPRIVNQGVKKRRRHRINPKTATTILPLKSGRFFWSKTFLSLQNAVFLEQFGILLQSHSRILFFCLGKGYIMDGRRSNSWGSPKCGKLIPLFYTKNYEAPRHLL